ncbi:hypothetical protein SMD44_08796 [Streptomyces alboflavus]|uniref:Uncharacterized protein n=1 Tax=Streptomyces alboflavus TaxID=67267 RepID=A0A1Z1WSE1_9ACTN|nr:hypothetical protein SMD44_08796 [Streptomyces alboflavus]
MASVNDESTDRATALLFASTGLAVSAPDYLGLGEGPGSHPYGHPKATVTAPVDGLRAARAPSSGVTAATWTDASSSAASHRADPPR